MAARKKKRQTGKTFRFQLSLGGIVGIGIVCCCLFMWMFLLGVWAGQTVLLPAARPGATRAAHSEKGKDPTRVMVSGAKTKPGAPQQRK